MFQSPPLVCQARRRVNAVLPSGDIQLNSTNARSISFQVGSFQEVKEIPIKFLTIKFCDHKQKANLT